MESSFLIEVDNTSILRTGALHCYHYTLNRLPAPRLLLPCSGLERSDFVPWPIAAPDICDGTSAVGESRHCISRWHPVGQPTESCLGRRRRGLDSGEFGPLRRIQ